MECPVCGKEIEDDLLYCPSCGYEIRIVPDFEAELENNIMENMSGVIKEINPEDEIPHKSSPVIRKRKSKEETDDDEVSLRTTVILCALAAVFVIFVIIFAVSLLKSDGSTTKKADKSYLELIDKADGYVKKGDYQTAIDTLYEALRVEMDHPEVRMKIADVYEMNNQPSEAENLYKDLFNYADYAGEAYDKYIAILEKDSRYSEICDVLSNCKVPAVLSKYPEYIASAPSFSLPEGTYEEEQELLLVDSQPGIIYYTTDGSEPSESSTVYTEPILLEYGKYTIRSIFVNQYGKFSEENRAVYIIDIDMSFNPEVTPAGGDYTSPEYIHVEVPQGCTVYYTTDRSIPTKAAIQYTHDLCMPLGISTYQFIAYDENGLMSDIVPVEYHLNIKNKKYSEVDAILITAQGLFERGYLSNTDGTIVGDTGKYSYNATHAFVYNDKSYYLMTESYTDISGNTYQTQVHYAVGINSGILYKADANADGTYKIIEF